MFVPLVTSRALIERPAVVLSIRGRGFQLLVRERWRNIPCFSARRTTVSNFCRPFVPLLIVVVPFAISWNHVPFSGMVVTSKRIVRIVKETHRKTAYH